MARTTLSSAPRHWLASPLGRALGDIALARPNVRKEGLRPMRFPVFVLMKECGEVRKFPSLDGMHYHLEAIDIENGEYQAWDADGTALELGTQKPPVWIRIKERGRDRQALIKALREFAASRGVEVKKEPSSPAEIEALLDSIMAKKR